MVKISIELAICLGQAIKKLEQFQWLFLGPLYIRLGTGICFLETLSNEFGLVIDY